MTALLATRYRVIGSGPVALACALFMVRGGIDPRRVHLNLTPAGANPAPADGRPGSSRESGGHGPRRMLALSDGSRQLLGRIIAMPSGGVIECIEVALSGRSGRARIQASDFDVAALGYVIAYPELVAALRAATDRLPFATVESSMTPMAMPEQEVTIHADGMPRPSSEASVAFGSRDVVSRDPMSRDFMSRELMSRDILSRHFNQTALLTEVMAEHGGTTAYECFGEHGPLALLPAAPGYSAHYAVVWCDRPQASAARAALTTAGLSAALNEALGAFAAPKERLGTLRVCAPVQTAPLSRLRRIQGAFGREVWIGNAAQALHPVAGQGLNLGLRDAFELARSLADNEYANRPLVPEEVLARFAASRRIDRSITTGLTDLLAAAFTWPLARPLQSALLTAMDLLPPVRRPLASTLLFGRR